MYLVIVYDVHTDRVSNVNKFLKSYLHWQQNSVFEGEVTKSQYMEINNQLKKLVNMDEDSIIIYKIQTKYMNKDIIGIEKNPISIIL